MCWNESYAPYEKERWMRGGAGCGVGVPLGPSGGGGADGEAFESEVL